MKIAIFNTSTEVSLTPDVVAKITAAVQKQVNEHYAVMWQSANYDIFFAENETVIGDACILFLRDSSSTPNALGDHYMAAGRPVGEVMCHPILDNGGTVMTSPISISSTISHEVLEMIGDPYINWWADMPDNRTEDAIELCDRTEGDSYVIDGVNVSNFLGPRAFGNGSGPFDFMQLLGSAFETRNGGYAIRRIGGPQGTVSSTFGRDFPTWKKALKWEEHSRLGKRHLRSMLARLGP